MSYCEVCITLPTCTIIKKITLLSPQKHCSSNYSLTLNPFVLLGLYSNHAENRHADVINLMPSSFSCACKSGASTSCLRKGFSRFSSSDKSSPSSHSFRPVCSTHTFRVVKAAARTLGWKNKVWFQLHIHRQMVLWIRRVSSDNNCTVQSDTLHTRGTHGSAAGSDATSQLPGSRCDPVFGLLREDRCMSVRAGELPLGVNVCAWCCVYPIQSRCIPASRPAFLRCVPDLPPP